MAGSKSKDKKVKFKKEPKGERVVQRENPEEYYSQNPSWRFSTCDKERWSIFQKEVVDVFWEEIWPRLQDLETQTWGEILIISNKQNHAINVKSLNKGAAERLEELYIEAESIISLRVTGKHRIYGYMSGSSLNVLWVDFDHGDNTTCVCRSYKKHT